MANLFDAANAPEGEPLEIVVGDFLQWKRSDLVQDYPLASYSAQYVARITGGGSSEILLPATETGGTRNLRAMRDASFRLLTSPVYLAEHGWHEPPWAYALDNGAWSYHQRGQDFDADAFARAVDRVGEAADFLVLPDVVAGGERSLELSMRWHAQLGDHPTPRYLVVQDGMGEGLPLAGLAGLFVGGTTEWKRSTMRGWARVAARHGLALHVGRVNSARLIREVLAIGAESGCPVSCDGTSATLYASTAPALGQAATGAPQLLLGLS